MREAFQIATKDAKYPEGKQDFYLASFGNFCILEIDKDGKVEVSNANVSMETQEEFEKKCFILYRCETFQCGDSHRTTRGCPD